MRKNNIKKGSSIIEVLIAFAYVAVVLTALSSLLFLIQNFAGEQRSHREALEIAAEMLDVAGVTALDHFEAIQSTTTVNSAYTVTLEVNYEDTYSKIVKVKVSWLTPYHSQASILLTGIVSDPRGAFGSSDCAITETSSWAHPLVSGSMDFDSTAKANDLKVREGLAYIAVDSASTSLPDFFIVDVSNANQPVVMSKINTGPGLAALAISGKYAYLANESITAQLQIVDISDSSHPTLVSSYKLPGTYSDGTTIGNSIYYYKSKIYLGTKKSSISELHMIDVKDPLHPKEIATWEVGSAVNAVYARENNIYIANPSSSELIVLDASHLPLLSVAGTYDAPGGSGNGKSLAAWGDRMYLGRTVGKDELVSLSITDSSHPIAIKSKMISSSINGMFFANSFLFIGLTATSSGFQVWKSATSSELQWLSSLTLGGRANALECNGNKLYVAGGGNNGIQIISP